MMMKLFKRAISSLLCVTVLFTGFNVSAAVTAPVGGVKDLGVISAVSIDGDVFYNSGGMEQDEIIERYAKECTVNNIKLSYDVNSNTVDILARLDYNEKDYVVNAAGIPYAEESVNYPKSMIVDTYTDSHEFTVVFLQIYEENNRFFCKTILEKNDDGKTFIIHAGIERDVFASIYEKAAANFISEETYFSIVTDMEKSPNYGGMYKDKEGYDLSFNWDNTESSVPDAEMLQSTYSSYNSRAAWVALFNSIYNNRYNGFQSVDTSNVDSKVFTEITASAGKYQWYSTSEGNFDYVVARLALYQVATNTYSFYIALLGSTTETQGENIGFKFGMYAKENEILPVATFRTEYNKSTNKIRYVADFGIKFKANISIGLTGSSQSFRRIERKANIAQNNDAWSLASFCIGYIPYIGDAVSLIQALYDTSYTTPTDSEWMRSDSGIYNAAVLDAGKNNQALYKNGDYLHLITYTTVSNASARFEWNYTCSI